MQQSTLKQLIAIWILAFSPAVSANPSVDQFLEALEQQNYADAATALAYPGELDDEQLAAIQLEVVATLEEYHQRIGNTEQTGLKLERSGNYATLGLSGGDEMFAMNHPPTSMKRVGAKFAKVGEGFITFMLSDIDGQKQLVFIQYDFKE